MDYTAFEIKADSFNDDEMTFEGYAATWDLDSGNDIIKPGAFSDTLAANSASVKLLWQHDARSPIGKPLEMREDSIGLFVKAKLSGIQQGREAYQLLKEQIIDRMSIGFMSDKVSYEGDTRIIHKARLFEFSLVTWPMNEAAIVTQVKSLQPKEIERVLREAGLTNSQAKCLVNNGLKGLREADHDEPNTNEQLQEIKNRLDLLLISNKLRI